MNNILFVLQSASDDFYHDFLDELTEPQKLIL